jgi:mono/diheme cytochrome c family protein
VSAVCLGAAVLGALLARAASPQQVERGRYIVEQVSACGDCHTPLDAKGMPDRSRWMQGSTLFFKPIVKIPDWVDTAPAIAGLVGYTDAQIVRALTEHIGATGNPLRPPMPVFRMTKADAEAVAAYLRTLKPAPKR